MFFSEAFWTENILGVWHFCTSERSSGQHIGMDTATICLKWHLISKCL
jgi:hypothetical protein